MREATELTPLGDLKLRSSQAESPRHYLAQADISRGPASTEPVARPHVATLTATIPWPRLNMTIWATIDVRCGHRRVAPTYRLTGYRGEDDRNHGFASLGTLRNGNGLRGRRCGLIPFVKVRPANWPAFEVYYSFKIISQVGLPRLMLRGPDANSIPANPDG